jgi:hypothetical protein
VASPSRSVGRLGDIDDGNGNDNFSVSGTTKASESGADGYGDGDGDGDADGDIVGTMAERELGQTPGRAKKSR